MDEALRAWLNDPEVWPTTSRAELMWAPGILFAFAAAVLMVAVLVADRSRLKRAGADDALLRINAHAIRLGAVLLVKLAFFAYVAWALLTDQPPPVRTVAFVAAMFGYGWLSALWMALWWKERRRVELYYREAREEP